jgi:hypothetical protein
MCSSSLAKLIMLTKTSKSGIGEMMRRQRGGSSFLELCARALGSGNCGGGGA